MDGYLEIKEEFKSEDSVPAFISHSEIDLKLEMASDEGSESQILNLGAIRAPYDIQSITFEPSISSHQEISSMDILEPSSRQEFIGALSETTLTRVFGANTYLQDECFKCKGYGHWAQYCPQRYTSKPVCYKCRCPGHLAP